ncbi:MAG: YtxH domain-containing protein [Cyclobacteriaceae bacterium]|nr:YtxH domain-containing protein [Cyclobacteriaceae bacterium]
MSAQKNLIGGILIGSAIGIAAGLLLAPQSGQKLRRRIARGTNDLKDDVVDTVSETIDSVRIQFNDRLNKLAANGKAALNSVTDTK